MTAARQAGTVMSRVASSCHFRRGRPGCKGTALVATGREPGGYWKGQHGHADAAPVLRSRPDRRPRVPGLGGYYLRRWPQVLRALIGLVRAGFGLDWYPTMHGAWLMLRASQLWAPYPNNHPKRARAYMRRFYALIRLTYGEPSNPAKAAELEVEWWRVHREIQHEPGSTLDELVDALTRLYCYLYGEPEEAIRPAAVHRAEAMDLSDQWVKQGCQLDSPLLPLEHAALVRSYSALLAAVHQTCTAARAARPFVTHINAYDIDAVPAHRARALPQAAGRRRDRAGCSRSTATSATRAPTPRTTPSSRCSRLRGLRRLQHDRPT